MGSYNWAMEVFHGFHIPPPHIDSRSKWGLEDTHLQKWEGKPIRLITLEQCRLHVDMFFLLVG